MSSKHKIGKFKKIFAIISHNADCGCANPDPTQVSDPKPISEAHKRAPPPPTIRRPSSSSCQSNYVDCLDDDEEEEYSSSTASATVASSSSHCSRSPNSNHDDGQIGRHFRGSVAVVKESDDPYQDFRQSMIQMMAARDIWSEEGLEELLKCFLRLNSPLHHEIIIQAYKEIRNSGGGGGGICNRQR